MATVCFEDDVVRTGEVIFVGVGEMRDEEGKEPGPVKLGETDRVDACVGLLREGVSGDTPAVLRAGRDGEGEPATNPGSL
jgi:hypothetical protein